MAITQQHVLTSKHCVNEDGLVGNCSFEVAFDGTDYGKLDFAILKIKSNYALKPVPLSVSTTIGLSIQIYFKQQDQNPVSYLKVFKIENSPYSMRSNISSSETEKGESGGPRMDLYSGYVHSIHDGF